MNLQISGLTEKEEDFKQRIYEAVQRKCERIGAISDIIELKAHFKKHEKEGTKAKHSVKIHMFTKIGDFSAESHDWEIMNALRESLRKIEAEFKHKKSRLS